MIALKDALEKHWLRMLLPGMISDSNLTAADASLDLEVGVRLLFRVGKKRRRHKKQIWRNT